VFEIRMLRKILEYKRREMPECRREMHKGEINDSEHFIKYY
jgi:hypothetical protein